MLDSNLLPDLPNSIDLEPTIKCNFSCVMCQRTYWDRKSPNMTFEQFTHIYNSFPKLDYIKIQGVGEPLLNQDLFAMIQHSKKHGSQVTTYTNGSLLHLQDNAIRLIKSGIDLIRISIDGGSKETYEKIRINSDFNQLVSNILLISKLRKGASAPRVELWTVGLPQNMHELIKIIDIADMAGIDTIHLQTILNTFDYRTDVNSQLQDLLLQNYQPAASYLMQAIAYAKKKAILLKPFASKIYSLEHHCHRPFGSLFVSVEGYVVPCCTIADPNIIQMGNILREDIKDIWTSENYQQFRLALLQGNLYRPCQNCYRESNKRLISTVD